MAVATIIAVILGPILAVQIQKMIERVVQRQEEKRRLFLDLMTTRDMPQQSQLLHWQALNRIAPVFSSPNDWVNRISNALFYRGQHIKDRAVLDAWADYRAHMDAFPRKPQPEPGREPPKLPDPVYESKLETWSEKRGEFLYRLLQKMADSLNLHFDPIEFKRGYTPQLYGDILVGELAIRQGLREVLEGRRCIPILAFTPPEPARAEGPRASDAEPGKQDRPQEPS